MRRYSLENSLHILAPILGAKMGVKVKIGGARPETDGNVIILPQLPLEDPNAEAYGFGFLEHESNHVRETDFSVERESGFVRAMSNVLEDIRIDRLGFDRYPGARDDYERLFTALIQDERAKECGPESSPAQVLETYAAWRLYHELLGLKSTARIAEESEVEFRRRFPEGVAINVDALIFEVEHCENTAEVVALTRRIARMLEEEAQEPQSDGDPTPGAGGDGNAPEPTPEQRAMLREVLDAPDESHHPDLGDLVAEALREIANTSDAIEMPVAEASDDNNAADERNASKFAARTVAASTAMRQRIIGLLQDRAATKEIVSTSGKRINIRRLAGVACGDFRVFRQRIQGLKTESAVQILVDRSDSMSEGGRIAVAREACFATAYALQGISGVSVAVAAFPGTASAVKTVCGFEERAERNASRFESLQPGGGTPMAEAMLWGAGELLAQRKRRRLLLVITDGAYYADVGRAMVARLADSGVEALGIGIACDPAPIFPLHRAIVQVEQLPSAMFELLYEALKAPRKLLAA